MRRRQRQNLLLAVVTGIAAVLVWWVVQREQQARPAPLTSLDAAAVRRLSVRSAHKPPRRFERAADGSWWMREPYDLPAHADAVARLLAITAARPRTPPQTRDPAKVGLVPPQAVLELDGQRLEFGFTDAINGDRYVRSAAGIALVPDRFSAWLLAPAESELDHRLAAPLDGVREVRVDGQARPELAAAWGRVATSQVGAAEAAPAAGVVEVELRGEAGQAVRYSVWRRDDGRYAALRAEPALLYPLEEAQLQFLLPPAAAASTEPAVR